MSKGKNVKLHGESNLRWRFTLASISGMPVQISGINQQDTLSPGLTPSETSFLDLLQKVTSGSKLVIDHSGTSVKYSCGSISNGFIQHQCPTEEESPRNVCFYLEPLCLLALFGRELLEVTIDGVTEGTSNDISIDNLKYVNLPLLKKFTDTASIDVVSRSFSAKTPGRVILKISPIRNISPLNLETLGNLLRVRGTAVARSVANVKTRRMIDSCKSALSQHCPDVWIYTDQGEKKTVLANSKEPGFGLCLVAESEEGSMHLGVDASFSEAQRLAAEDPSMSAIMHQVDDAADALGTSLAKWLLQEVAENASMDSHRQAFVACIVACAKDDGPSKFRVGKLAPYMPQLLRDIKSILGVEMQLTEKTEVAGATSYVAVSCRGCGVTNSSKPTF